MKQAFRKFSFSSHFWYVAGLMFCSLLYLLFQGGKVAVMVFIILGLLCVYLALGRWSGIARVNGTRTLVNAANGVSLGAGTSLEVKVEVSIPGFWPIPYVSIRDRLSRKGGGDYVFETSFVPDWRRKGEVTYLTPPLDRGYYRYDQTECTTVDIFGLFEHQGSFNVPQSFRVLPRTTVIQEWKQFHQWIKGQHHQAIATQAWKETTQINGVREYIYGDRISKIHWNATAKTGTWKSKEFERESLPKTYIVLDRDASGYPHKETFELAVSVAASLLEYGLKQDMAIGLISIGSDIAILEPHRGQGHYQQMMEHLIDVQADGKHALLNILKDCARQMSRGGFAVIISPQDGEIVSAALNWINQRQMIPCHLWISTHLSMDRAERWRSMLKSRGYLGYRVNALEDLSDVLGGKKG